MHRDSNGQVRATNAEAIINHLKAGDEACNIRRGHAKTGYLVPLFIPLGNSFRCELHTSLYKSPSYNGFYANCAWDKGAVLFNVGQDTDGGEVFIPPLVIRGFGERLKSADDLDNAFRNGETVLLDVNIEAGWRLAHWKFNPELIFFAIERSRGGEHGVVKRRPSGIRSLEGQYF